MKVRIAVPVELYCDVEIPSRIPLTEAPIESPENVEAVEWINAALAEYLGREEGLDLTNYSTSEGAEILNVRVFPADDDIPCGEWTEVDRQAEEEVPGL